MSITAPETEAREQLKTIIDAEFASDGFTCLNDKLHESLGRDGTRLGISPTRTRLLSGNDLTAQMELFFQFYSKWNAQIEPTQRVDPAKIENYAERFRRACQANRPAGDDRVWFYRVTELNYPDDPTGNKTRFEATIIAYGNNTALVETTG